MPTKSRSASESTSLWERIQEAFGVRGPTEIASKLGFTKQAVYKWQNGEIPGLETLTKIAATSGVSLHWLVTGEGPKTAYIVSEPELRVIKELTKETGLSLDRQIHQLISDAIETRGLVKSRSEILKPLMKSLTSLSPSERRAVAADLIRRLSVLLEEEE